MTNLIAQIASLDLKTLLHAGDVVGIENSRIRSGLVEFNAVQGHTGDAMITYNGRCKGVKRAVRHHDDPRENGGEAGAIELGSDNVEQ